jgi:ketosteroid isomerase-like protein
MKRLLIALLILPFVVGCTSQNRQNKAKDDVAVVEKYVKAVENLDYPTMKSLLADNYMGYGPSYGDSIDRKTALAQIKYNVKNLYKSIHYNKVQNIAVTVTSDPNRGDWVSSWGELHIVYQNGKAVTLWANSVYRIENGKIVKSYTFYNEADALRQLGYVVVDPTYLK